jgi:hypothetical protein
MRQLMLIAAVALVSTAANAGPSRGLSAASADATQPVTQQPKTPIPATATATVDKPAEIVKPKRAHVSTEARVIYELHRHGIYW